MHRNQLQTAIDSIEAPHGDGYDVRIHLSGGGTIEGAHHALRDDGLLMVDVLDGDKRLPAVVLVSAITAIERID